MSLAPNVTFRRKSQTTNLYQRKKTITLVRIKSLEMLRRRTQRVAHGIMQLAGLCLVDAKTAGQGNRIVAAASQRDDFGRGTQIECHAFRIQDAEVRIALEQQIRQRLQENGNVVEELFGKACRRVFE